ncbi:hypothetical protein [Sphingobacterium suaedae]|uniref:Uncharacterized protein n=1 Tax=Sphingobacterium suaedae TaxID=1686402 RepID=A0ABW5KE23_9SPHI
MTRIQKILIFLFAFSVGISLQLYVYIVGLGASELTGVAFLFGCILTYGSLIYGTVKGIDWVIVSFRNWRLARASAKTKALKNDHSDEQIAPSF